MRSRLMVTGLVMVLVLAISGCGSYYGSSSSGGAAVQQPSGATGSGSGQQTGGTSTDEPGQATSESRQVEIKGFAFSPQTLTVPVGTTVAWTNKDGVTHTATARDGSFDSGLLGSGASFSFTFTKAGTYDYFCEIHTYMSGSVVVE